MKKLFTFTVLFCLVVEQSKASGFGDFLGQIGLGYLLYFVIPGMIIAFVFKVAFPKKEDPHGHGHGGHGDHGHGHDNGHHDSHGGHNDNHGHDSHGSHHDKKHDNHTDNHAPKHDDHKKHDNHANNHIHPKPAQKSGGYNHHDNDNARRFGQKTEPHH